MDIFKFNVSFDTKIDQFALIRHRIYFRWTIDNFEDGRRRTACAGKRFQKWSRFGDIISANNQTEKRLKHQLMMNIKIFNYSYENSVNIQSSKQPECIVYPLYHDPLKPIERHTKMLMHYLRKIKIASPHHQCRKGVLCD